MNDNDNIGNFISDLREVLAHFAVPGKWFVTSPIRYSTVSDICFKADPTNMAYQVKAGLQPSHILLVTDDESVAKAAAEKLIAAMPPAASE
jgi:hypothetical protein